MKDFIEGNKENILRTLRELCEIPAPSHFERERALYCLRFLKEAGAEGAYIDEADNVVFPVNCEGGNITVINAHLDTVFPDTEPMPYIDDGEYIRSPGVGDDTASVVILMYAIKYCIENGAFGGGAFLFVLNSCEEGLGNLKGIRRIFRDFEGRISRLVALDSTFKSVVDRSVGSERYEVTLVTEGGHSYNAFGNRNAIAELSRLVTEIYSITVPKIGNSKTTYNVGGISGGTSVNTIAESATMLCEYRSDNKECLSALREKFREIFDGARARGLDLTVNMIGERPCMGEVDKKEQDKLTSVLSEVVRSVVGRLPYTRPGSTDCNIPHSLGIPAVSVGVFEGEGSHTRNEWIYRSSVFLGVEVSIKIISEISEEY